MNFKNKEGNVVRSYAFYTNIVYIGIVSNLDIDFLLYGVYLKTIKSYLTYTDFDEIEYIGSDDLLTYINIL